MASKRRKFVLYTNPNNVTNKAYIADGARNANGVLKSAETYPGSYTILYQGTGNNEDITKVKQLFPYFRFV